MPHRSQPVLIATRGSALALAQAHLVFDQCRRAFPQLQFELKIIKTTGDKLATASLANPAENLPKGLFTKELEVALLKHRADLAVHSLKDLPTELPAGLKLGAVGKRADVRDVLLFRDAAFLRERAANPSEGDWTPGQAELRGCPLGTTLDRLPRGAIVATSSTRRAAQVLALRPDLKIVPVRGNVITRMQKLAERADFDALLLAAAGLERLQFTLGPEGRLSGDAVPDGIGATMLAPELILPCVGQAALGIEVRENDERIADLCERLNHYQTHQCVAAERAFLRAMGGGCQSPVAAYAMAHDETLHVRAVAFHQPPARRGEIRGDIRDAVALGESLAAQLK